MPDELMGPQVVEHHPLLKHVELLLQALIHLIVIVEAQLREVQAGHVEAQGEAGTDGRVSLRFLDPKMAEVCSCSCGRCVPQNFPDETEGIRKSEGPRDLKGSY